MSKEKNKQISEDSYKEGKFGYGILERQTEKKIFWWYMTGVFIFQGLLLMWDECMCVKHI